MAHILYIDEFDHVPLKELLRIVGKHEVLYVRVSKFTEGKLENFEAQCIVYYFIENIDVYVEQFLVDQCIQNDEIVKPFLLMHVMGDPIHNIDGVNIPEEFIYRYPIHPDTFLEKVNTLLEKYATGGGSS